MAVDRTMMAHGEKADGSAITEADTASDVIIAHGLAEIAPLIPVVSEERAHLAVRPYKESFFLVDPLDGTKEFVSGRDEFTVNIALVAHGQPVLGIIGAPALGLIWRGVVGSGAERLMVDKNGTVSATAQSITTRPYPGPAAPCVISVSRSHGDARSEAFIADRHSAIRLPLGSAIKFCRVAEGSADVYPRLSPTSEWDVAAGCAVVAAAGGLVTDAQGRQLQFGLSVEDFLVPNFIAWGDPAAACPV
ncbi:MAG: 3'(2'),5'-bisphosphate nucleotidase CysQ [Xanthobacteraceae bacterium]|nr:3'(2'),5'-bisphosphate nucleotidase CysQ [Xanthobacteraceae bacterium]